MRRTEDDRLCQRATAKLRVRIVPTIRRYRVRFSTFIMNQNSCKSVQSQGGYSPSFSKVLDQRTHTRP